MGYRPSADRARRVAPEGHVDCSTRRMRKNGSRGKSNGTTDTAWAKPTVSGPAEPPEVPAARRGVNKRSGTPGDDAVVGGAQLAAKRSNEGTLAAGTPHNPLKAAEYDDDAALEPRAGKPVEAPDPSVGGSTLTEIHRVGQDGSRRAADRGQPDQRTARPRPRRLDGARAHHESGRAGRAEPGLAEGRRPRADAARGLHPAREDHALRPRAHPRARRARARLGRARLLRVHEGRSASTRAPRCSRRPASGRPVFVRFSTVAGERGSTDTARDVRGFAVKFYTDEGNLDLVGNNIPVFFIQDAMKFPDLVHAVKPEPHHGMPQAASAHDTFWDFVSLMPESTHMLMWVMSDRAIPRSYRMMQGFGVHTFRLVNAKRASRCFCKFHWKPVAGTHSLVWDEAVKISGADSDFHRRDLWEAIEAGAYPGVGARAADLHRGAGGRLQLRRPRPDEDRSRGAGAAHAGRPAGAEPQPRQLLRRDRAGGVLHGAHRAGHRLHATIRCMQGRIHSYVDTQLTRLGGPNFHEIPINAPVAAGAQQPARRLPPPGDPPRPRRRTSRTRSAAAVRSRRA